MVIVLNIGRNVLELLGKFQNNFKNLQTNGHFTWKTEYVSLLTSNIPQRVFVGLKNFQAKTVEMNVQCLFYRYSNKKMQIHVSDYYAISTLLYFLNFPYIFHMDNWGIKSLIFVLQNKSNLKYENNFTYIQQY